VSNELAIRVSARNETLDSLKLVAIFFVVVIHTFPLYAMEDQQLVAVGLLINQISRFAVPSFFVVSGYLFATHFNFNAPGERLFRTVKRVMFLYVFWCLFYLLPYNVVLIPEGGLKAPWDFSRWHFYMWTASWENFLFGGSKVHLWFLPALACAATISTPFIVRRKTGYLVVIGLALFVLALLAAPYKATPVGIDFGFYTRNGPFLATVFFACGAWLALHPGDVRGRLRIGWVLTLAGLVWHLAELFWLKAHYESYFIYDFNSGTLAYGVGVAMLGIYGAKPLQWRWLRQNGQYSLGIYLLHLFVLEWLLPMNTVLASSAAWSLSLPFIATLITLYLVRFLMRYRICRGVLS